MMLDNILQQAGHISEFIAISAGTIIVGYVFDRYIARFFHKSSIVMKNDPTNYKFLRHFVRAIIYIVGFSWAISEVPSLKTLSNSLLAGAGIITVALGFASQQAFSNIISGLFIVIFKPFRVNDRLKIVKENLVGIVEDITLRHTVIRDFENKRIIIPNAVISNEILINSNFSEDKIIKYIEMNVAHSSDIDRVRLMMRDEVMKHPLHFDPRTEEEKELGVPEVQVRVIAVGEYFITIRAWACAQNVTNAFELSCDLLESIKKRFDSEGIEMPIQTRQVLNK
jgi:small conductance mechanosensitive channel